MNACVCVCAEEMFASVEIIIALLLFLSTWVAQFGAICSHSLSHIVRRIAMCAFARSDFKLYRTECGTPARYDLNWS